MTGRLVIIPLPSGNSGNSDWRGSLSQGLFPLDGSILSGGNSDVLNSYTTCAVADEHVGGEQLVKLPDHQNCGGLQICDAARKCTGEYRGVPNRLWVVWKVQIKQ